MAQTQLNGARRAARPKPALPKVVPAIPLALKAKKLVTKKEEVKANGEGGLKQDAAPSAQEAVQTSTGSKEEIGIAQEKVGKHVPDVQMKEKEAGADNEATAGQKTVAAEEVYTNGSADAAGAHDGLANETQQTRESSPRRPSETRELMTKTEEQEVSNGVGPRATTHSSEIRSPVVFGGTIEPDTFSGISPPNDQNQVEEEALVGVQSTPATIPSSQQLRHDNHLPSPAAGQNGLTNGDQASQNGVRQNAPTDAVPQTTNGHSSSSAKPSPYEPQTFAPPPPPQPQSFLHNPKAANFINAHPLTPYSPGAPPPGPFIPRQTMNPVPFINHDPRRTSIPMTNDVPHHEFEAAPTPKSLDRDTEIAAYIHSQFGNAEFADYVLRFPLPPFSIRAHSLIIARSPRLRSLMAMPQYYVNTGDFLKPLDLRFIDRFLNHDVAFMKALMRLYGEVLPDTAFVLTMAKARAPYAVQQEAMRFALSFTAVGHYLQIEELVMHGLSLSASLMSWENVNAMLSFALEGGLSPTFTQATDMTSTSDSSRSDGTSTPSKQMESPASSPAYGIYSDRALHNVVGYLVYNWPANFRFSSAAPQLSDIPRLPAVSELPPMHERNSSRLSQIRFGDMTREEEGAPNFVTTTLSSILLTLPFPVLAHIFNSNVLGERVGWERVAEVMQAVVSQREQRRLRALQHGKIAPPGLPLVPEDRLWNNTRWVESVETTDQHPAGVKLVRHFATGDAPPSVLTPVETGSVASS